MTTFDDLTPSNPYHNPQIQFLVQILCWKWRFSTRYVWINLLKCLVHQKHIIPFPSIMAPAPKFRSKDPSKSHLRNLRCQCNLCHDVFYGNDYKAHMASHHSEHVQESWHECKICGERFHTRFKLDTHHVINHGSKKMACSVCPFTFVNYERYLRHFRAEHPDFELTNNVHLCYLCRNKG